MSFEQPEKIMATPIEVIKGVIAEGETILTSASLSTYRKLENEQVVQDKTYVLSGPISYDGINLSGIVDDSFVFHEDFRLDQYYSLYSDAGELLFVRNPNGSTINYKWYGLGTYLMSKTINTTHTVTYKYKPLIGILEEVDFSGNSFYYMYDNDGNLIAKKDQDHHIREIYNNNVVNSDGSIIIGENSYSDLDLNPLSDLSISEQSGNLNIELFINSYENIYQYEIDFGDGTIETADHEYISHTYAEAGDFTVKMKVKRNNIVLAQDEEIIDVNLFPMTASFLYVNPTTNDLYGEINNETTNDLNVELSVANGTGNYTVNWEVTHKENPDLSFTETDQITDSVGSSDIDIISNGSYRLKCTITNGEDTIIKTWDFIIE